MLPATNPTRGNPQGVDTMSLRTIAAGAVMLAVTLAMTAPAPAESGAANPSTSSADADATKPHYRAAKQRDAAKARHGKRSRLALARERRKQSAQPADESIRRPTAPARAESPPAVPQETAAARRFRDFLDPQSFAVAAGDRLRSPRLLAAQLSAEIADPTVFANWTEGAAAVPRDGAPPIVARDQTMGGDSPSMAPALAYGDPVPVARARQTEKEPGRMSLLRWFFVAWGGVLTFASAVRMTMG